MTENKNSFTLDIQSLIDSSELLSLTNLRHVTIPLMITKAQRERLLELGHTEAEIFQMKPGDAHAILAIPRR